MNTITLTEWRIREAMTRGLGFNRHQAMILGVKWPLRKGWLQKLIGREVDADLWEAVRRHSGDNRRHRL